MADRLIATGKGVESGIPTEYRLECDDHAELPYLLKVKYDMPANPSVHEKWIVAARTATAQSAYRIAADAAVWQMAQ